MRYHEQILVSDRVIDDHIRLIAGINKKSGTYILLVPTVMRFAVTELYYRISREEYEAIRADKKKGFEPFLKYAETRYQPVEDDRFLGISSFGMPEAV